MYKNESVLFFDHSHGSRKVYYFLFQTEGERVQVRVLWNSKQRTVHIVRKSILSFTNLQLSVNRANIEQGTAFQKLENLQRNIRVGGHFSGAGVNMILRALSICQN